MKVRLYSDLHNEFSLFDVPVMKDEHLQILILAGDIGIAKAGQRQNTIIDFLEELSPRFHKILYVLGNHEFYGCDYSTVHNTLYEETDHLKNVVILQDSFVRINDVIFVGATLWTDFKSGDSFVMNEATRGMNDYRAIKDHRSGYRKLSPETILMEHYNSKDYIFHIASENRDSKIVMITHHAISYGSVAMMYRSSSYDMIMNYNFFSDLDEEILANDNIVLAVHGHTHTSFDYKIGNTRVVCNPRGYETYNRPIENRFFNKELIIKI